MRTQRRATEDANLHPHRANVMCFALFCTAEWAPNQAVRTQHATRTHFGHASVAPVSKEAGAKWANMVQNTMFTHEEVRIRETNLASKSTL